MKNFRVSAGLWLFLIAVFAGGVYLVFNKKPQNQTVLPRQIPEPTAVITPLPTDIPLPTNTPAVIKQTIKTTPANAGATRGQLTCDYQVPATPDSQGTAVLNANWNNLVSDKNGKVAAAVCVSINGDVPKLMSVRNATNGSMTIGAPWISLNGNYNFILYDQHGGEMADCAGIVLSSCRINTKN